MSKFERWTIEEIHEHTHVVLLRAEVKMPLKSFAALRSDLKDIEGNITKFIGSEEASVVRINRLGSALKRWGLNRPLREGDVYYVSIPSSEIDIILSTPSLDFFDATALAGAAIKALYERARRTS